MNLDPSQKEVIAFLSDPKSYGDDVKNVDIVKTYISMIFLAGERVFKLKRDVCFSYLDFSTPELRHTACQAEVAINRRTAPDLYKGITALTRTPSGELQFGGDGQAVDWLVEMARFDESALLDQLAQKGKLNRRLMEDLADTVANFHLNAEKQPGKEGTSGLITTINGNAERFADCAKDILDLGKVNRLTTCARTELERLGGLLDGRRKDGKFRRCHGDLHLRNIFLAEGTPTLFDAIEFNDAFSNIDMLYDFAFLLMDLDHRDMRRLANIALNRYQDIVGDEGGLAALPLFLSLRAAIRAHVSAASGMGDEARAYLDQAQGFLEPTPPRLIAVGGFSGSGKSRMGREIAPFLGAPLGARIIRSDSVRKRLAGVSLSQPLGQEGYTPEKSKLAYAAFFDDIAISLKNSCTVIADAVFANPDQRQIIAQVAADAQVPFHGLWLEASEEVRGKRVTSRKRNISDATADLVRKQSKYNTGIIEWIRIDSSGPKKETLRHGITLLGQ